MRGSRPDSKEQRAFAYFRQGCSAKQVSILLGISPKMASNYGSRYRHHIQHGRITDRKEPIKRCHPSNPCGTCRRCQDEVRWERIFQKFTDPAYYQFRPVTQKSTLA